MNLSDGTSLGPGRRVWLWLGAILLAVAVVWGAGWIEYRTQKARRHKVVAAEVAGVAADKLADLAWWTRERLADARQFQAQTALLPGVSALLSRPPGQGTAGERGGSELAAWMSSFLEGEDYSEVLLVDREARVRAFLPATAGVLEPPDEEGVREVVGSGRSALRDLPWASARSAPRVNLLFPVAGPAGEVLGVVVLRLETRRFMARLLSVWPLAPPGSTGLVRKEMDGLARLSFRPAGSGFEFEPELARAVRLPVLLPALVPPEPSREVTAGGGVVELSEGIDHLGRPALALARPVKDLSWWLVVQVDRGAVEASLRGQALKSGGAVLAWVLAALAGGGWILRQRDNLELGRELVLRRDRQTRLEQSEAMSRGLVENLPQRVFIKDLNSVYVVCNSNLARWLGVGAEEVVGKGDEAFHPAEVAERLRSTDLAVVTSGKPIELEERHEGPAGTRWIHTLKLPYRDAGGKVLGVFGISEDVTRRKEMERAVRSSDEKYRSLFNQMLDGFALHEILCDSVGCPVDYRFLDVNPAFEVVTGLKATSVLGRTVRDVLPALEPEWIERYGRVALTGESMRFEMTAAALGRDFEVMAFRPKPGQFACTFNDVTARKRAEKALRASLGEKDALLKEVHHRVKNNLQIVSSLLHLQSGEIQDETAVAAFRNTEDRVRSMALLHETLYRSGNLARAEVGLYLEKLCSHLTRAAGGETPRIAVGWRVPEGDLQLELDLALPFGLLVNELVSNALKHGFPGGRAGRVAVEVRREGPERLILEVADNGVGLPPGLDFTQARSLGFQLIRGLATQLGGEATVHSEGGVVARIVFRP